MTIKTLKDLEAKLNKENGNLSGVYKITRKSDGRVYIGQSVCITDRIIDHIKNIRATSDDEEKGIDAAIQRDGWEAFDYEVVVAAPELNAEQLWMLENVNIAKYDSCNNGFNKTKGNHVGKYDHADFVKKHVVHIDVIKHMRDHFRLDFSGKKVLLINLFDQKFVDKLQFDDCEVRYISKYTEDKDELSEYILEELKKVEGQHFDLIIANPPYGKIGANITKTIIDTVDFDEYVNLLPANDYKRNDTRDLFKYVELDTMKPVKDAFADAAVTTHMARIIKEPHNYISWDEFQIENYTDNSLKKYFYENIKRKHYAIDSFTTNTSVTIFRGLSNKTTYIQGAKDVSNAHLPYSKKCVQYLWNVDKSVDGQYVANNCECYIGGKENGRPCGATSYYTITFNAENECNNFVKFIYSDNGFRFMSKLFTAMNVDSYVMMTKFMPKVDWTREWTVEEILVDYGYTAKEIQEVMDDLINFKGMED